jgi:hypothetical protein
MLLHFTHCLDRVFHALTIAQQHVLVAPDRLTLRGALGDAVGIPYCSLL